MALKTRVTTRYSADAILKISNPDAASASVNDDARLDLAVLDAEAEFEVMVGVVYDDTDAKHQMAAVQLVVLKLMEYGSVPSKVLEGQRDRVEKLLERLGEVTARDRVEPKSSSQLTPSDENPSSTEVRPAFDDQFFVDLIPGAPQPPPIDLP